MNYCQDGLHVYIPTEKEHYNSTDFHGDYELQTNDVNGRPYFKMGKFGFWWDIRDLKWMIGLDSKKGETLAYAYNRKDVFCPHQLSEWDLLIAADVFLYHAGNDLVITCCKCMHFHSKQSPNSIFNSKMNFS